MKLLTELKSCISELGPVRRVWLTTFNLNLELVEAYLLPAVLGEDPPRNRLDFEQLQKALVSQGIDFRVFTDKRMLSNGPDLKRTSINVFGISPRAIEGFSEKSLFHPKLIYLESTDGRAILGAGSANLTIDGWARNQEVFVFRKISTSAQARALRAFFEPLLADLPELPRLSRKKWGDDDDWTFVHSFQKSSFLSQLLAESEVPPNDLAIWSPYFPQDLSGFLSTLRQTMENENLNIHVVPDFLNGEKIRTKWNSALHADLEQKIVRFYDNKLPMDHRCELRHAKMWLTKDALAIGSWNCTHPGSNILTDQDGNWHSENNVEAGIIISGSFRLPSHLGSERTVSEANFLTDMELAEQALEVPEELPFEIAVLFNWETQEYEFQGSWHQPSSDTYMLLVPDLAPIPVVQPSRGSALRLAKYPVVEPQALVSDHFFQVKLRGKVVFQGVILESGLTHRRGEAYQSLDDLLNSLLPENQKTGTISPVIRTPRKRAEDEDDDPLKSESGEQKLPSYFRLFHAFEAFKEQLERCQSDPAMLEALIFVSPGCIKELHEKVALECEKARSVYTWFLASELNSLIRVAKRKYKNLFGNAKNAKWAGLPCLQVPIFSDPNAQAYIRLIQQECGYA